MSKHSEQTGDDNSKVISQALRLILLLYIFNSIIISNNIKYYVAIEEILCRYSMAFINMLSRSTISYEGFVIERTYTRTQGS